MAEPALSLVVPVFKVKVAGSELPVEIASEVLETQVDQSLSLADMGVVLLSDREATLVDDERFEIGSELEIILGIDDELEPVFKGEIVAIEPTFPQDGPATLLLRAYDKSHRLQRSRKTRTFLDMKDSDVVANVAQEAGLASEVEKTETVHKAIYQNNLTDLEFLRLRARRIGFELVFTEDKLRFRKPKIKEEPEHTFTWGRNLQSFRPDQSVAGQVSTVKVLGWDPLEKEPIVGKSNSGEIGKMGGKELGLEVSQSAFGTNEILVNLDGVKSQGEADTVAQGNLREQSLGFVRARGIVDGNSALRAGDLVEILDIGERFSGNYYLSSCTHRLDRSAGYRVEFAAVRTATKRDAPQPAAATESAAEEESKDIEIRVEDVDGNPLSGKDFVVTFADGTEKTGTLGDDGLFQASNVPPGRATLRVVHEEEEE